MTIEELYILYLVVDLIKHLPEQLHEMNTLDTSSMTRKTLSITDNLLLSNDCSAKGMDEDKEIKEEMKEMGGTEKLEESEESEE
ncbi:hypothetical protein Glove_421g74 [Diversispora epigaea]|uniref:Uncharacterized protein n=1 Tax=Diversispora epigaea TaxID=1348612 RepID=A0A397H0Y8_9GLOM|nr:hypothetical protein Glove_421g74 [Diversispora epigaea]